MLTKKWYPYIANAAIWATWSEPGKWNQCISYEYLEWTALVAITVAIIRHQHSTDTCSRWGPWCHWPWRCRKYNMKCRNIFTCEIHSTLLQHKYQITSYERFIQEFTYRWLTSKLWYFQIKSVGDTIVYLLGIWSVHELTHLPLVPYVGISKPDHH